MKAEVLSSGTSSPKEGFMKKNSFLIALILMFAIMLAPLPEGLTSAGKNSIAIFVFALVVWLFRPFAEAASSLLILTFLIIFQVTKQKEVFGALGSDTNFLVLSGLIISVAMAKTNLAKRMALTIITKFGKNSSKLLLCLMAVNFGIAFLMPSGTARSTLLLPIALAVIAALGVKEGEKSNIAKQVTLTVPAADHFATSSILTATGSNILAMEMVKKATGTTVYYSDWLLWGLIPNIMLALIWWVMIKRMFPSKNKSMDISSFQNQLKEMGSFSKDELRVLGIFTMTVVLWISDRWTGLNAAAVALLGASLLFVPKVGVLNWKETNKKINWGLIVFNAAAIASGAALGKTKATNWVIDGIFDKLNLHNMSPYMVLGIILAITMLIIVLTSSKTGRITMLVPILIGFAQTLEINPLFLIMPVVMLNAHHFVFPFNAKSNLIYFGTGHIHMEDMVKSGTYISIIGIVVFVLISMTYWKVVGLTF